MTAPEELLSESSREWLGTALGVIRDDADAVFAFSARAVRDCGAADADVVRRALVEHAPSRAVRLFREGDPLERIAVLRTLHRIDVPAAPIIEEALRCNDTRIIEAALGPRSAELADHDWRRAVLKFAYLGLPFSSIHGLDGRLDDTLRAMLRELIRERVSAGRSLPAEIELYS